MDLRRYIPFTQQPFCCVPACLQMILYRRQLPLLSQEDIGLGLGLIVPEELATVFPKAEAGPRPAAGWGTRTGTPGYTPNEFFENAALPLREEYHPPASCNLSSENLSRLIETDVDIIVCFEYGILYDSSEDYGHTSLIESVSESAIVLVDPEHRVPKFRSVSPDVLRSAIDVHGEAKRAGLWCITGVNTDLKPI